MITGPFDSAVRSLLVGIIELGVEEVMVIGHTDCGVAHINADMMIRHLIQRGRFSGPYRHDALLRH